LCDSGRVTPESTTLSANRLEQQVGFILELDKLKAVMRQTQLPNQQRRENSAEHSWHLATMALVLAEHAQEEIEVARVVRMLLIHDVVEIDAGDAFIHDPSARAAAAELEQAAAARVFGLLPPGQADEFRALWREFDARITAEAKFAHALDRLIPILHNYHAGGGSWLAHGITKSQVIERCRHMQEGSAILWKMALRVLDHAEARNYFRASVR
jgi:putative hydrolase of HD superfamily